MPAYSPGTTSISFDGALIFPSEEINFTDQVDMKPDFNVPFSRNIWWKAPLTTARRVAFAKGDQGVQTLVEQTDVASFGYVTTFGETLSAASTALAPAVLDDTWKMITGTYDGSSSFAGLNIFINGVQMTGVNVLKTGSGPNGTIVTTDPVLIGEKGSQVQPWLGLLTHASGWDFELTPANVAELYSLQVPLILTSTSFADPVWWAPLGDGDAIGAGGIQELINGPATNGTFQLMDASNFELDFPTGPGGKVIVDFGKGNALTRPTLTQIQTFGKGGLRN